MKEKQRFDGNSLAYKVQGHSQDGVNWRINRIALVTDDILGISDRYLVSGRTFRRDRNEGTTTRLRLSPLGLVA
jgi:prophage tail gpP-like protein